MKGLMHLIVAVAAMAGPAVAMADPAAGPQQVDTKTASVSQDVATLLFGRPQWSKAPVGSAITYSYVKKTDEAAFGQPFDDRITIKLDAGADADRRTAEVKMFSGVNARPAGPFDSVEQNPVLLLVLEENVQELSKLFKANPRYLKNAIRKAWRDNAKIEPTAVVVNGKSVPGTRITVTPFANDPESDKMLGLEGMTYTVALADEVPGEIALMDIRAPASGPPKFSEVLHYQPEVNR